MNNRVPQNAEKDAAQNTGTGSEAGNCVQKSSTNVANTLQNPEEVMAILQQYSITSPEDLQIILNRGTQQFDTLIQEKLALEDRVKVLEDRVKALEGAIESIFTILGECDSSRSILSQNVYYEVPESAMAQIEKIIGEINKSNG
ncbi:hypothetical protein CSB09_04175 [Candidatus Gracilibacteria bacterium]|nr:MAG: hypothetical protein CSB09_04175 [Candidatus Gracilibacteria bacterium]